MKIVLDEGAKIPTRAHDGDAGLDLYAKKGAVVPAKGSAVFDTGVHVEIPYGAAGFLKSKSGLNILHGITSEGVVDYGYTGGILVKLYNNSDKDYVVKAGDKITQLVVLPVILVDVELAEELTETERGDGKLGSSGR